MRSLPAQALTYTVWPRAARSVSVQANVDAGAAACAAQGAKAAAPARVKVWRRLIWNEELMLERAACTALFTVKSQRYAFSQHANPLHDSGH